MKITLRSIVAALFLLPLLAFSKPIKISGTNSQSSIDLLDTIYFEIDHAEYSGGKMLIPISIHSDDTIYALDFELRFNYQRLQYDTIYDPSGRIQPFVFLNPADSVLRLTSYSVNPYKKDTTVFILRFNVLSLPVLPGDIYQVYGYLNGDSCSIGQPPVVFTSVNQLVRSSDATVYPNPFSDEFFIRSESAGVFTVYSINGKVVYSGLLQQGVNKINSSDWEGGFYFLKYNDGDRKETVKLIVE